MSDYSPDISKSGPGCGGVAMYILSAVLVIFTIGAIAAYVVLFVNPDVPFNPFSEPTLTATAVEPIGTATEVIIVPPTYTPTSPVVPSATQAVTPTSAVTATEVPTATSEPAPPTTPSPTPFPLVLQPSGVKAAQGFKGCSWTGISGQIFGPNNGAPISYLLVHLEGMWNSRAFDQDAITGSAPEYGPGGYEFNLGTQAVASDRTLWVQAVDAAGMPLSEQVYLTTYADCEHNLLIVNFNQVR
ncbi:MAG TPA: hypothetical protein VJJ70_03520 [Anaerolineales bacterium]|nr:hypothetical protein [Anaerolineales bacterium]